ncbi:hypothetical protein ACFYUY_01715 [Kitasatospora sp. NPDC004745]|uniref:hypothetical protein n=1 Tax=Kitasatospora sp. NPDC004745 TaxID=3364019 RepID=UPI0036D11B80
MSAYPHRLRLRGGRNTHAARPVRLPDDTTALLTPCGYMNGPRDELKTDGTVITCRACVRTITTEETAR